MLLAVIRGTFKFGRTTNNMLKIAIVRKVGQNLFDGRTNRNDTPGTTTITAMDRPIGRKLVRTLNIFASALMMYSYATFVVLIDKMSIATSGKVRLARSTLARRVKDVKGPFITMVV